MFRVYVGSSHARLPEHHGASNKGSPAQRAEHNYLLFFDFRFRLAPFAEVAHTGLRASRSSMRFYNSRLKHTNGPCDPTVKRESPSNSLHGPLEHGDCLRLRAMLMCSMRCVPTCVPSIVQAWAWRAVQHRFQRQQPRHSKCERVLRKVGQIQRVGC